MIATLLMALALVPGRFLILPPGDHVRTVTSGGAARSFQLHIPHRADPTLPVAVVLALHSAAMDGEGMRRFSGLDATSDVAGFVVAYPNGSGAGSFRTWNVGGLAKGSVDDVAYLTAVLDDIAGCLPVDARRVYATGMSNGAMMCYRLASERSDRIAAIAPVAGTMTVEGQRPTRPVPVIHFHGTEDRFVPYEGPAAGTPRWIGFHSVERTILAWSQANGCPRSPRVERLPDLFEDGTVVDRWTYGPGREDAAVVLYRIQGGGHTWPGRRPPLPLLGRSTRDVSANERIWAFFLEHPRRIGDGPTLSSPAGHADGQPDP